MQLLVENNTKKEYLSGSSHAKGDGLVSDTQTLSKLQEELRQCKEELHVSNETSKTLLKEKSLLEQKIQRLEKKNDEKSVIEMSFEDERRKLKLHITELEQRLKSMLEALNSTESTLTMRTVELDALQNNLNELEELREFKEVQLFPAFPSTITTLMLLLGTLELV